MSTEENKALVRRFYDEVSNGRNLAVLDEILSPNFEGFKVEGEDHPQNREEFKDMMAMVLNAFPDHHQIIHDWIAENDKVVTRWTIEGTQQGEYMGIAPTGKQVKGIEIDIFRVVDGKIVELWAEVDMPHDPSGGTHFTATPRRDLESLIADLYASPPLAVVTGIAGGVVEVFGTATPLFAEDMWKVETEHWHVHSLVSEIDGYSFGEPNTSKIIRPPGFVTLFVTFSRRAYGNILSM
jgi:predicted ester cyclase